MNTINSRLSLTALCILAFNTSANTAIETMTFNIEDPTTGRLSFEKLMPEQTNQQYFIVQNGKPIKLIAPAFSKQIKEKRRTTASLTAYVSETKVLGISYSSLYCGRVTETFEAVKLGTYEISDGKCQVSVTIK